MKKRVIGLSIVAFALMGFMSVNTSASELSIAPSISAVDCQDNVCVVDEARNRFLAKGCKEKPSKDCTIKGPKKI